MHHCFNGVLFKNPIEEIAVGDITNNHLSIEDSLSMAIDQVVENDDFSAALTLIENVMAADIASSAGDQYHAGYSYHRY